MKWQTVKTAIIIMLLAVDAFLLFEIIRYSEEHGALGSQTLADAAAILQRRGIELDSSALPARAQKLGVVNFVDSLERAKAAARDLLGQDAELDESGGKVTLQTNDGAVFIYDQSCRLIYQRAAAEEGGKAPSDGKISAALAGFFKALGFPQNYYRIESVEKLDGKARAVAVQMIKDKPVFGSRLEIYIDDGGAKSAEGIWYFGTTRQSSADEKDMLNVLFEAARHIKEKGGSKIKAAEQGFLPYIYIKSGKSEVGMLSSWRFDCDIGTIYYDAVSGRSGTVENG